MTARRDPPERLAVIIPCRDAAATLETTLACLAVQTRPPDEVIVVDDGSRDASARIVRDRAARSGMPLRTVNGEARGAAAARALGACETGAERLLFLDADDLIGPDTLAALERALDGAPTQGPAGIACCEWQRLELDGLVWRVHPASCAPPWVGHDDLAAWLRGRYHPPAALLWSREALELAGGWDASVGVNDDGDLVMRALAAGVPLVRASGGMAWYRRAAPGHDTLSGSARTPAGLASRLGVLERLAERLRRAGRLERYAPDLAHVVALVDVDARRAGDEAAAGRVHALLDALPVAGVARRSWAGAARASRRARHAFRRIVPRPHRSAPRPDRDAAPEASPRAGIAVAEPLVSVVIPTWRRPVETLEAVASVLAQTYAHLELIVVDDASGDGTLDALAAVTDPRLRTIALPANGGVARARNAGIAAARGELVALLDSDDLWLPDKLRLQVARFATGGPRLGLVYTGCENLGGGGPVPAGIEGRVFDALLRTNALHGAGSGALLSRDALELAGPFDPAYPAIEDWDLWTRLARFVDVGFVPQVLVHYRDDARPARRSRAAAANRDGRALRGDVPHRDAAGAHDRCVPRRERAPGAARRRRRGGACPAPACAARARGCTCPALARGGLPAARPGSWTARDGRPLRAHTARARGACEPSRPKS